MSRSAVAVVDAKKIKVAINWLNTDSNILNTN